MKYNPDPPPQSAIRQIVRDLHARFQAAELSPEMMTEAAADAFEKAADLPKRHVRAAGVAPAQTSGVTRPIKIGSKDLESQLKRLKMCHPLRVRRIRRDLAWLERKSRR